MKEKEMHLYNSIVNRKRPMQDMYFVDAVVTVHFKS